MPATFPCLTVARSSPTSTGFGTQDGASLTWMPCPMRVYGNEHRDDAARWLASLPAGDEPSIAHERAGRHTVRL